MAVKKVRKVANLNVNSLDDPLSLSDAPDKSMVFLFVGDADADPLPPPP